MQCLPRFSNTQTYTFISLIVTRGKILAHIIMAELSSNGMKTAERKDCLILQTNYFLVYVLINSSVSSRNRSTQSLGNSTVRVLGTAATALLHKKSVMKWGELIWAPSNCISASWSVLDQIQPPRARYRARLPKGPPKRQRKSGQRVKQRYLQHLALRGDRGVCTLRGSRIFLYCCGERFKNLMRLLAVRTRFKCFDPFDQARSRHSIKYRSRWTESSASTELKSRTHPITNPTTYLR
jgi:hypothetical protein